MKRFVSLKGQPIHIGHCHLIMEMLNDYEKGDELIIAIVNPYPLENMDLSRNRKPSNFHPKNNPLTYYERLSLIKTYLSSLIPRYGNHVISEIKITPYFLATIHDKDVMYNYLDIKAPCIEYISNKDSFELGKEKELRELDIDVKFFDAIKTPEGDYVSADNIRSCILDNKSMAHLFDPSIYMEMNNSGLFDVIRNRIIDRG